MHTRTLAQLAADLRARRVSATELTRHFLGRIERFDGELNAFITVTAEQALAQAAAADERLAKGDATPLTGHSARAQGHLLHGGREDVVRLADARQLRRAVRRDRRRAPRRAPASSCSARRTWTSSRWARRTRRASTAPSAIRGITRSCPAARRAARPPPSPRASRPRRRARTRAARFANRPRSSGITGLKPTYGRVSRYGMIAFASSLDQAGVLTQTAEDAALLLEAMAGFDARDSTSLDEPVPRYSQLVGEPWDDVTIGVPESFFDDGLDADNAAARARRARGAREARREAEEHRAQVHPPVRAGVLRRRAGRSVVELVALRRRALRPSRRARRGRRRLDDVLHAQPRRRLRRRGQAPDPDRARTCCPRATSTRTTCKRRRRASSSATTSRARSATSTSSPARRRHRRRSGSARRRAIRSRCT